MKNTHQKIYRDLVDENCNQIYHHGLKKILRSNHVHNTRTQAEVYKLRDRKRQIMS